MNRNLISMLALGVVALAASSLPAQPATTAWASSPVQAAHPMTGSYQNGGNAHPDIRVPYSGELIPMSAHAINPVWGAPAAPSLSNLDPMNKHAPANEIPKKGIPAPPNDQGSPELPRVLTPSPQAVPDAVSVGAGSSDFMYKTVGDSDFQSGTPSQSFWDPCCGWTNRHGPVGGGTLQSPAITTYRGQFQLVVLGTDGQIYQAFYNPPDNHWYGWYGISLPSPGNSRFTSAPAVVEYNGDFHVFVRGNGDSGIWHAWYSYSSHRWYGWNSPILSTEWHNSHSAPAVAVYTGNGDRNELHIFFIGQTEETFQTIEEVFWNGSTWIGPFVLDRNHWASAPAVAQYGNSLQVWAVWAGDRKLYQAYYLPSDGRWHGWYRLSDELVGSAPAVATFHKPNYDEFQVFYVYGAQAGSWETHEAVYIDRWYGPFRWGNLSSAPAVAQFGRTFQVWWRDN